MKRTIFGKGGEEFFVVKVEQDVDVWPEKESFALSLIGLFQLSLAPLNDFVFEI